MLISVLIFVRLMTKVFMILNIVYIYMIHDYQHVIQRMYNMYYVIP